jgi:drug/metabolite transporter (DMT)-like permease
MAGAGLLVGPDAFSQGLSGNVVRGFLMLQIGGFSWGLGSILQKQHKPVTAMHPVASAAVHQFAAGLAFLPMALLERAPALWDAKGIGALLYLTVFGSIVGYTSYIIALGRLPISIVSLYTYINPVVAAILGWMFYREPFGRREIAAMLVIFAGVAIVKRFGQRK